MESWYRNLPGKTLKGVCMALAVNLGLPVTLVRLAFVLLTFYYGLGALVYILLCLIIPKEKGMPVSLTELGRTVKTSIVSFIHSAKHVLSGKSTSDSA